MAAPDLNGGAEGFASTEERCAYEQDRARKIIHVDMDAFYASVEQRDNQELRGKPVAVGGSRERGVVAAASYEARKFGVRSAMPSITARRKCPDLIFVKPRFDVYKAVSLQIRAIFAEYIIRADPVPTHAKIELAVERLRPNWTRGVPRSRTGGASHILQSLAHGRGLAWVQWLLRLCIFIDLVLIWFFWNPVRSEDLPISRWVSTEAWWIIGGLATALAVTFKTYEIVEHDGGWDSGLRAQRAPA
jgi:hypothetical protein